MKIKINQDGELEIFRKDKYQLAFCPYNYKIKYNSLEPCGTWCALFGEFNPHNDSLQICKQEIYVEEIIDERI